VGVDRVLVSLADSPAGDVAGGGELGDDAVRGARSVIPIWSPMSRSRLPGSSAMASSARG